MSGVVEVLLLAMVALTLVPVAVLFVQAVVAFAPAGWPAGLARVRPRIAVMIPAHDESSGMIPTLRSVLPQLRHGDRCVVVADNCSDDTAAVAAREGAEVVERRDFERRGKGYALDFGLRALEGDSPEVVVVVDADCVAAPEAIDRIARLCLATGRPVQALYLMRAPDGGTRMRLIAEFAWRVKNWGRPLGFLRLRLPCQLMGTGMAFPASALRAIDLASGDLVEDIKMGLDLARLGFPPLFCPDALVTSTFPANEAGAQSQRTRWEHGHLAVIVGQVPSLLKDAVQRRSASLLAMALDIAVPPLALLVMLVVATFVVTLASAAFSASMAPAILSTAVLVLLIFAVVLFWIRFGAEIVPFATLVSALYYALIKIPVYVKFVIGRQMEWVKSKRDGH